MSQIGPLIDRYNAPDILGTTALTARLDDGVLRSQDSMEDLYRAVDARPWIEPLRLLRLPIIKCLTNTDPLWQHVHDLRHAGADRDGRRARRAASPVLPGPALLARRADLHDADSGNHRSASPGYEVATQLSSTDQGMVEALRFWRAPGESGNKHLAPVDRHRNSTRSGTFVRRRLGASGWQEVAITPVQIQAGTRYRVSVNTNTAQSKTNCGIGSASPSAPDRVRRLLGTAHGCHATNSSCSNFFRRRDLRPRVRLFTPDSASTPAPLRVTEVATQFSADRNGTVKALRFWRAAGETATPWLRLWTDTGRCCFGNLRDYAYGLLGWQQIAILPWRSRRARANASLQHKHVQAKTTAGSARGSHGSLTPGRASGASPSAACHDGSCSNFFADVVFDW